MAAFYTYYVISRAVDVSVRNIVRNNAGGTNLISYVADWSGSREIRSSCLVRASQDCAIRIDPGDRRRCDLFHYLYDPSTNPMEITTEVTEVLDASHRKGNWQCSSQVATSFSDLAN